MGFLNAPKSPYTQAIIEAEIKAQGLDQEGIKALIKSLESQQYCDDSLSVAQCLDIAHKITALEYCVKRVPEARATAAVSRANDANRKHALSDHPHEIRHANPWTR